jgi:hypothetical protein
MVARRRAAVTWRLPPPTGPCGGLAGKWRAGFEELAAPMNGGIRMNRFIGGRLLGGDAYGNGRSPGPGLLDLLIDILVRGGILDDDLDYHFLRAAMVIIFFFFGYQKWWAYEAQRLVPISATVH